jgi:gamma-glutamyltranspeptidase
VNLKEYVLATVLPDNYYQKRFSHWNPRNRPNINCVFGHEDNKPSLSIGLKGGGARCHSCGKSIGNIVHFESERVGIEEAVAAARIYSEFIRPVVQPEILASLQSALAKNSKVRAALESDCGITAAGIAMFA